MNKWYQWFYITICWAIGGIINYFDGKPIIGSVVAMGISVLFAFIQFFCYRKGEKGRKAYRYIAFGILAVLAVVVACLLFGHFR